MVASRGWYCVSISNYRRRYFPFLMMKRCLCTFMWNVVRARWRGGYSSKTDHSVTFYDPGISFSALQPRPRECQTVEIPQARLHTLDSGVQWHLAAPVNQDSNLDCLSPPTQFLTLTDLPTSGTRHRSRRSLPANIVGKIKSGFHWCMKRIRMVFTFQVNDTNIVSCSSYDITDIYSLDDKWQSPDLKRRSSLIRFFYFKYSERCALYWLSCE